MLLFSILLFIVFCFLLARSSVWTVRSLVKISRALEWSGFLSSFVIMALATSLPELFVGLSSAFHGYPQLSFGNVIGANILNLTLGIGIAALILGGLKLESKKDSRQAFYTSFFAVLPLILMLDHSVSRVDGLILLFALGLYYKKLFKKRRTAKALLPDGQKENREGFKLFLKDIGIFFGSVALLLLSAEAVVRTANVLSIGIGMSLVIAGAILIAVGTALPEIVFGARAAMLGRKDLAWGNFLGTVVINSTLILGLVALISPLKVVNFSPYSIGILFTFIVAFAFALFAKTGRQISKKEALVLIGIYILFVLSQLLIG